jgi:hypothetical protein
MNTSNTRGTAAQLCAYTGEIFLQMAGIAKPYLGPRKPLYRDHIGAHLRHIIEHYGALATALATSGSPPALPYTVDYDARARNMQIETDPVFALDHVALLKRAFEALSETAMVHPVEVHVRGGLQGEHNFITTSSVARELMFLNSHATHHFAIVQGYAHQRGETLGEGFGKAPATVAHEQSQQLNVAQLAGVAA